MAQEGVHELSQKLTSEGDPPTNRVLLVDDDRITLNYLSFLFRSLGWDTRQSLSGEGALDILKSEPMFELMIIDLQMPGMHGLQLLEKIREIYGPKPVVFIFSSFIDQSNRAKALALGAQTVIHKSTNSKDIYELLKTWGYS
jgi:CheY-like chemotaxis protein